MDVVYDIIKDFDGIILYVIFALQCALVFLGFPILLCKCSSPQKRAYLSYTGWMIKWSMLSYCGKWMMDTYELVELQMEVDNGGQVFDPYKLLHIKNNGDFNTTLMHHEFDRLANMYHPNIVRRKNSEQGVKKVPMDKAVKRWENLNKAFATLTEEPLFENFQKYGDPDGAKCIGALHLAVPYQLMEEEYRPMVVTWAFVASICLGLGLKVWCNSQAEVSTTGIQPESKESMKEFMIAILEDNPKSERIIGFSDVDMIEIYEQSVEVISLNEELGKRGTFNQIIKYMMERVSQGQPPAGGGGDACCGGSAPKTPPDVIVQYLPKLTETLIEVLAEKPFNGKSIVSLQGKSDIKYKGEMLLQTILSFTIRVLGGKLMQKRKIAVEGPSTKEVKLGDSFDVKVNFQKYPFVKEPSKTRRIYICLANLGDNSLHIQTGSPEDVQVEKTFKIMPMPVGDCNFRAFVVSSDGQIEKSEKDITVKIIE